MAVKQLSSNNIGKIFRAAIYINFQNVLCFGIKFREEW